jgi:hypothetical protein
MGDFFTNSSGHPVFKERKFWARTAKSGEIQEISFNAYPGANPATYDFTTTCNASSIERFSK